VARQEKINRQGNNRAAPRRRGAVAALSGGRHERSDA
jgi:hypothetical protein